jgi:hypothetical protein
MRRRIPTVPLCSGKGKLTFDERRRRLRPPFDQRLKLARGQDAYPVDRTRNQRWTKGFAGTAVEVEIMTLLVSR